MSVDSNLEAIDTATTALRSEITAERKAAAEALAARDAEIIRLHATIDRLTPTVYGATVPSTGWAALADFQTRSGVPLGLVRCYPAGKMLDTSLAQVRRSVTAFPKAAIVFNPLVAGRSLTAVQLTAFVKAIEVEAAKVPAFFLVPDAEPDRKDRGYTDAQFLAAFRLVAELVEQHAPHVEMSLNLTGYDFANRIARYKAAEPYYTVLSLDPYWTAATNAVQGTTDDLNAAVSWASAHAKKVALAEWGAEGGDPGRLNAAFDWIHANRPVFSAYFQEDAAGAPIRCAIKTPEGFAAYRAGVTGT